MISIVVACRNEAGAIDTMLRSAIGQDFSGQDWELLIADGDSADGTRALLGAWQAAYPQIRMLENPRRITSTGLNAAIRAAKGEIILRMDAHTEYASDYVRQCLAALESTGAWNVGGPARTRFNSRLGRAIAAAFHSPFSTGGSHFHDPTYEGFTDTVPYGCWRKQTLEQLGMFDEDLVRNQDDELNRRITRAAGKIWQTPKIVSWYTPRQSLRSLFRQYFQYGFWKVPVMRKDGLGSWRAVIPALFVLGNLIALFAVSVSWILGDHVRLFLSAWLFIVTSYAVLSTVFALSAARKFGWALLPLLLPVFATYHCSYGAGLLVGAVYWTHQNTGELPGRMFTELSR